MREITVNFISVAMDTPGGELFNERTWENGPTHPCTPKMAEQDLAQAMDGDLCTSRQPIFSKTPNIS